MKSDAALGLPPDRLVRLLGLIDDAPEEPSPGGRALGVDQMLRATLAGRLRLDASAADSLPAVLGRPCGELEAHRDEPLGGLLTGPGTDLATLRTLKDYSKALVLRSSSEAARAAATTLYYAAIAAGVVFYGEKITQLDSGRLDRGLAMLIEKPWMPPALGDLMTRARSGCRNLG
jgi:hypothetical protein